MECYNCSIEPVCAFAFLDSSCIRFSLRSRKSTYGIHAYFLAFPKCNMPKKANLPSWISLPMPHRHNNEMGGIELHDNAIKNYRVNDKNNFGHFG